MLRNPPAKPARWWRVIIDEGEGFVFEVRAVRRRGDVGRAQSDEDASEGDA